nr:chemotaxis protein CheB [Rhizobium sp. Root708]
MRLRHSPDRELLIEDDHIVTRPFNEPRGRRAPIDMFFRSIAAARGDGIAVVLPGVGADGAIGVKAVKEAGGVFMVQEPWRLGFPPCLKMRSLRALPTSLLL